MPTPADIRALLAEEPNDPFLLYALAQALAGEADHAAALEQYDRTLAADPRYFAAYYHKAKSLIALGRLAEARSLLQTGIAAAAAGSDHHTAGEMSELLAGIDD